jgi:competence protein ComEC
MVFGWLWLCLWTTRLRLFGAVPFFIGAIGAVTSSTPDVLITGDGKHVAVLAPDGRPLLLRDRSGDFMLSLMSEASGLDDEPGFLSDSPTGSCSRDACISVIRKGNREWRLLATRSFQRIDWAPLVRACREADIVVSERWLPRGCNPRWLKLDRKALEATGGVSVYLGERPRVTTVAGRLGSHPWAQLTER